MVNWLKCRKLPVVVEAIKIQRDSPDLKQLIEEGGRIAWHGPYSNVISVVTFEGEMTGFIGDYLMRGVEGEYYICKERVIKKTYEVLP